MVLEWSKLRPWEGSQEKAFEELCCQLAGAEKMLGACIFTRKGAPDAGIECFWTLSNGEEWAWQAKFFFQMQEVQWRELDESVEQALGKHPKMTQYCICLPIDFPDPRIVHPRTGKRKKFAQDSWDSRVQKWRQLAVKLGRRVDFVKWGQHEILNRLTEDEHLGRRLFWFNEQWFGQEWFRKRVEEAHENAGKRYLPLLHVGLDLENSFDALGRGEPFFARLSSLLGAVRREFENLPIYRLGNPGLQELTKELGQVVNDLLGTLANKQSAVIPLPFTDAAALATRGGGIAFQLVAELRQLAALDPIAGTPMDSYSYERHCLLALEDRFVELLRFLESPSSRVANTGALLLVGDAGTGKTHMFCEIARRRVEAGEPTVLLLGQQFMAAEPWSQVLNMLGLNCSRDQFLGALDAAAEVRGTRALILLDAINEEHGLEIWPQFLPGMLAQIKRHARIGIALSVRSSYEESVVPAQLETEDKVVRFVHSGFQGHEEQGVDRYFAHYGIELPSFPVLNQEFSNPLFLRTLCEGLQNRGVARIPEGLTGFSAVFEFFLNSINEKLARPELLDYDAYRPIVMQAIQGLVHAMVKNEGDWVARNAAVEILEGVLPRSGFDKSLFRRLVDEGVITEERMWVRSSVPTPGSMETQSVVRFQYQRFGDYLITKALLHPFIEAGQPQSAFESGHYLGAVLADPASSLRNQGIVEALAALVPETTGDELVTLMPGCSSFDSVKTAICNSLTWRDPSSISAATWLYLENYVLPDRRMRCLLFSALVLVAPDPAHPYNAKFLHRWLEPMGMTDRDAIWSVFLATDYARDGATARLLRWAETFSAKAEHDDTMVSLSSMILAWLLASSNRVLRDRSTKALVELLTCHIPIAGDMIKLFGSVNDGYIVERVAAAAYGAAMRSLRQDDIVNLAIVCYEQFFARIRPPLNALVRDYARGIIELALHLLPSAAIDVVRIRPPYGSSLPTGFDPGQGSYADLDWNAANDLAPGLQAVHHSVTAGDFSSYVLRDLSNLFFEARLGNSSAPTRREVFTEFVSNLNKAQRSAWEEYQPPRMTLAEIRDLLWKGDNASMKLEASSNFEARERLEALLTPEQERIFRSDVRPYVEDGYPAEARKYIALAAIEHFILGQVLGLKWRRELDDFDRSSIVTTSRSEHSVERLGKKYQWLAFYDMVGLLADNFQCKADYSEGIGRYVGPWQVIYGRNIDPSLLLRSKPAITAGLSWWGQKVVATWSEDLDEVAWLKLESDLPNVDEEFLFKSDSSGSEWVVLEGNYRWTQPPAAGRQDFELPQREISYTVTSCLVCNRYASAVLKKLLGLRRPLDHSLEPRSTGHAFLGELHWAPAYRAELSPYYGYEEWTKGPLPHRVLVTTEHYYAEPGSFDASMDESIRLVCPSHWIVEKMSLRWNGVEGEWCGSSSGRPIFRDPSARRYGPSALLARRTEFEAFLNDQGCSLIWIISGTKWALGGRSLNTRSAGRNLISGALQMKGGKISGKVKSGLELFHDGR
jgi:hypothetical protein